MIYTGSIGWYLKNYWFAMRSYITPNARSATAASATLSMRKYFKDGKNYVALNANLGFSPDLSRIQNSMGFSENEIYLLKSHGAGLMWQTSVNRNWTVNLSADMLRQALTFDALEYIVITSSFVSLKKKI